MQDMSSQLYTFLLWSVPPLRRTAALVPPPGIIQKTGGGGGFITYMAMIPQKNIGAFVVVTRSPLTRFKNMSDGINDLVTELSGNKPLVIPAS